MDTLINDFFESNSLKVKYYDDWRWLFGIKINGSDDNELCDCMFEFLDFPKSKTITIKYFVYEDSVINTDEINTIEFLVFDRTGTITKIKHYNNCKLIDSSSDVYNYTMKLNSAIENTLIFSYE